MRKRSLCLALLLLTSLFAEGCCWCNRPFLFRPWLRGGCCESSCCATPCCGTSYFGGSSCCGSGGPAVDSYSVPPLAPGVVPGTSPTMPSATPLVRARLGMNK